MHIYLLSSSHNNNIVLIIKTSLCKMHGKRKKKQDLKIQTIILVSLEGKEDEARFVFVIIQTRTIVRGQITQLFFLLVTEF